jgi:hypothetical protein
LNSRTPRSVVTATSPTLSFADRFPSVHSCGDLHSDQ